MRGSSSHFPSFLGGAQIVLVLLGAGGAAQAHDSPEHVIEALTARIQADPKRPDLFWQRAIEHRVMGELRSASRDLQQALKLQQGYLPALTELSRVRLAQGKPRQALVVVNRALGLVRDDAGRAPLCMVRAEVRCETGDWRGALSDCETALTNSSGLAEVDWYLTRSQIQIRLGLYREAVAGLNEGLARTGSAVLEVECLDALIDGGFFAEARPKIEPFLAESRWPSAWLIRRARVRLGSGEVAAGQADLLTAVRELNERLRTPHPQPGLLADRGLAYALLGDLKLARRDLEASRKLGADDSMLRRLRLALGERWPGGVEVR